MLIILSVYLKNVVKYVTKEFLPKKERTYHVVTTFVAIAGQRKTLMSLVSSLHVLFLSFCSYLEQSVTEGGGREIICPGHDCSQPVPMVHYIHTNVYTYDVFIPLSF